MNNSLNAINYAANIHAFISQQTICGKLRGLTNIHNTLIIVKIYVWISYVSITLINNPQITNAQNKTFSKFNKRILKSGNKLSMQVGISEAICLLFK